MRSVLFLLALALGAVSSSSPAAVTGALEELIVPPTVQGGPEVVAVVEEWGSDRVLARQIFARDAFDARCVERAPNQLLGFTPEESTSRSAQVTLRPAAPIGAPATATGREDFFARSAQGLLGDRSTAEEPPAAPAALPERVSFDVPEPLVDDAERPGFDSQLLEQAPTLQSLDPEMQRLIMRPLYDDMTRRNQLELQVQNIAMQTATEDERVAERNARRYRIQFQQSVIEDWVERTLISMEARRRGLTVSDAQMAAALVPMVEARLAQAEDPESETRLTADEITRLESAVGVVALPPGAEGAQARATLRAEVDRILGEMGQDPERFYAELEENLLAEQLIRQTVNEYYTEADLRAYHEQFREEFIRPARYQYVSIKYIGRPTDGEDMRRRARDAFGDLARSVRRIGPEVALDDVLARWQSAMDAEDDLPASTYLSLSNFQNVNEMPAGVAEIVARLAPGETSRLIETSVDMALPSGVHPSDMTLLGGNAISVPCFTIVRLVNVLPEGGHEFEEVRARVEEQFFAQVRPQLLEALRAGDRYHILVNQGGLPLGEALRRLNSPDAPAM